MKKFFIVATAIALALSFTVGAYAKDTVQMTLTSPAIVKKGCEKAGAVTYAFDGDTVLSTGDWWYFDMPANVTVCKAIDYIIGSGATPGSTGSNVVLTDQTNQYLTATGISGTPALAVGASDGPFSLSDVSGGAAIPASNLFFRIKADQGSQRIWTYVYGGAGETLTVPTGTILKLATLNGKAYNTNILLNTEDPAGTTQPVYGEIDDDTIAFTNTNQEPHVENTLCVNAESYGGSTVHVSFASKLDQLTFTGDSQIAHVMSENPIALLNCKLEKDGYLTPESQQNGTCSFSYEDGTNYCPGFSGNKLILAASQPFGNPADLFDIAVKSETPGVYFSGQPTLAGYATSVSNDEACDSASTGNAITAGFVLYNESGAVVTTPPTGSCSVSSGLRVREARTSGGAVKSIDMYNKIWVNLPTLVYDLNTINSALGEVRITIVVNKYPCGEIFSETKTIGTFVAECPSSGSAGTTLLYPWFPPMDGSIAGWWGGFVIVNASDTAGTATLTFWEVSGDKGTLTTPSIAAGGQWNAGAFADLIEQITPASANAGTMGDENFAVTANCAFTLGGGFAFTGNSMTGEGTGYTAYVKNGTLWQ